MDRLGTWEVPFTSTCERTGSLGRRLNNGPGPEVPSDPTGSASCKTRSEEDHVDPGNRRHPLVRHERHEFFPSVDENRVVRYAECAGLLADERREGCVKL